MNRNEPNEIQNAEEHRQMVLVLENMLYQFVGKLWDKLQFFTFIDLK